MEKKPRNFKAFVQDVETRDERVILLGSLIFSFGRIEPEYYYTDLNMEAYEVCSRSGKVEIIYKD